MPHSPTLREPLLRSEPEQPLPRHDRRLLQGYQEGFAQHENLGSRQRKLHDRVGPPEQVTLPDGGPRAQRSRCCRDLLGVATTSAYDTRVQFVSATFT